MTVARGGKRGKTSGRGGKGQTARAGNKRRPEWRDIIKKLPKLRGRGKNSNISFYKKAAPVNLVALEAVFSSGDAITPAILFEKGVVSMRSGRMPEVKILGEGEITKSFKVTGCSYSVSAKAAIEKAGGSIIAIAPKAKTKIVAERTGPKAEEKSIKAEKEKSGTTGGKPKVDTPKQPAHADKAPHTKAKKPGAGKKA